MYRYTHNYRTIRLLLGTINKYIALLKCFRVRDSLPFDFQCQPLLTKCFCCVQWVKHQSHYIKVPRGRFYFIYYADKFGQTMLCLCLQPVQHQTKPTFKDNTCQRVKTKGWKRVGCRRSNYVFIKRRGHERNVMVSILEIKLFSIFAVPLFAYTVCYVVTKKRDSRDQGNLS